MLEDSSRWKRSWDWLLMSLLAASFDSVKKAGGIEALLG